MLRVLVSTAQYVVRRNARIPVVVRQNTQPCDENALTETPWTASTLSYRLLNRHDGV